MSNEAIVAWNDTVSSAATTGNISIFIGLLYFGSIMLLGAWLISGLLDSFRLNKLTLKQVIAYIARFLFLLIFSTYLFL